MATMTLDPNYLYKDPEAAADTTVYTGGTWGVFEGTQANGIFTPAPQPARSSSLTDPVFTAPVQSNPDIILYDGSSGSFSVEFSFSPGTLGTVTGLQAYGVGSGTVAQDLTFAMYRTPAGIAVLEYGVQKWALFSVKPVDGPALWYTQLGNDAPVLTGMDPVTDADRYTILVTGGVGQYLVHGAIVYTSDIIETADMVLLSYFYRDTDQVETYNTNHISTGAFSVDATQVTANRFAVTDVVQGPGGDFYFRGTFNQFGTGGELTHRIFLTKVSVDGILDTTFTPTYAGQAQGPIEAYPTGGTYGRMLANTRGLSLVNGRLYTTIGRYPQIIDATTGVAYPDSQATGRYALGEPYAETTTYNNYVIVATTSRVFIPDNGMPGNYRSRSLTTLGNLTAITDSAGHDIVYPLCQLEGGGVLHGLVNNGDSNAVYMRVVAENGATHGALLSTHFSRTTNGHNCVARATLEADGSVLICGSFTTVNGAAHAYLVRMLDDASGVSAYSSFTLGAITGSVAGPWVLVAKQEIGGTGKIWIGGDFASVDGDTRYRNFCRLNPDLTLDTTYLPTTGADKPVRDLIPLAGGRVLVVGEFDTYNGAGGLGGVFMLAGGTNNNGALDSTFQTSVLGAYDSLLPYNQWAATNGPPSFSALSARGGVPLNEGNVELAPLHTRGYAYTVTRYTAPQNTASVSFTELAGIGLEDIETMNVASSGEELTFEALDLAAAEISAYSYSTWFEALTCSAAMDSTVANMANGHIRYDVELHEELYPTSPITVASAYDIHMSTPLRVHTNQYVTPVYPVRTTDKIRITSTGAPTVIFSVLIDLIALGVQDDQLLNALFDTWAVNLSNSAHTRYENFPFTSFTEFDGKIIAASDNGLFVLGGHDDAGEAIDSLILLARSDFGSSKQKRVSEVYLGVESDGQLRLRIIDDNEEVFDYTPRVDRANMSGVRVQIGKGLVSRYWQLELANVDGADFELDTLEFNVHKASRREI